jgi:membrane-associated protease RseP (regulator of RpoE activity)
MSEEKPFLIKHKVNIILFILTILSTFYTGMMLSISDTVVQRELSQYGEVDIWRLFSRSDMIFNGVLFSLAIMSILTAHELGHYLACRKYKIDATLPYFIPFPTLIGTMGAFIKIKAPITSRKSLFDIGAAGPLSGFILIIPWMYIGLKLSTIQPMVYSSGVLYMQDPLLTNIMVKLMGISVPAGYELMAHPVYIAAWFGCLATAINLIPVGQLDGGHIIYSLFSRKAEYIYKFAFLFTCVVALIAVAIEGFLGWGLWILIIFFLMRRGHPPTLNDYMKIGKERKILATVTLVVLILTFMPIPIRFSP